MILGDFVNNWRVIDSQADGTFAKYTIIAWLSTTILKSFEVT